MPKIATIFALSSKVGLPGYESLRSKALEAMALRGVVDESTLVLEDVTKDAILNFGTEEDPILISLKDHNLVAVRFSAEATPHDGEVV